MQENAISFFFLNLKGPPESCVPTTNMVPTYIITFKVKKWIFKLQVNSHMPQNKIQIDLYIIS